MSKLFRRFTKTARDSQDVNQNHGSESERPNRGKSYRSKPGNREHDAPKSSEREILNEPISSASQDSTRATPDDHIGNCKQNSESSRNLESHQMQKSHATKSGLPPIGTTVCNTMAEPSVASAPSCEATVQSPPLAATNGYNGYVERRSITTQVIKQPLISKNQAGDGTGHAGTLGAVVVASPDQGANIINVQMQQKQQEVSVDPVAQASIAVGGLDAAADKSVNSLVGSPETISVSHQLIADKSEAKQGTMPNSSLARKPRQSSAFQIRNPETGEVLNSGQSVAKHPKPPTLMQPTLVTPGSQPNGKLQQALLVQTQPSLATGPSQVVVLQAPASSSPIQFSQLQQAPVFVQTQQPTQMIIQPAQFTLQQPQQQQQQQLQLQVVPHLILQPQAVPVQVQVQAQPATTALAGTTVTAPTLELQQPLSAAGDYLELAPVEESNLVPAPSSSSSSASAFCGVVMGSNTSTAVTVAQMSQCAQMLQQRLIYRQGALGGSSSSTSVLASATTPSATTPGILVPEVSVESGLVQTTPNVYGGSLSQTAPRTVTKATDLTRKYLSLSASCTRMRVQNRPLYPNQMLVSLLEQQMSINSGRLKSRKISNVPCVDGLAAAPTPAPTPTVGTRRSQGLVKGRVRAASTSTSTASMDSTTSDAAVASATCAAPLMPISASSSSSHRGGSKSSINMGTLRNDLVTGLRERDRDRDRDREQKLKRRERERERKKKQMAPTPTSTSSSPKASTPIATMTTTTAAVDATPKTVATTVCSSESTPRAAPLVYEINDLLEIAVNCEIQVPEEAGRFKIVDAAYGGRSSRFSHGHFHPTGSPISTSPPPSAPRRNFERGGRSGSGMYVLPSGSIGSCGGGPNSIGSVHSMSSGNKWRKEGGPHQPKPLSYYQRDDIKPTTTLKSSRELTREEQFQREVRSLLNKLTVENFLTVAEKLAILYESLELEQDVDVMVSLVHDKAIAELDYSDMYADLAYLLKYRFNEKLDIGFKSTCFHRTLLNRCQVSFEEINHETLPDDGASSAGAPSKKWVLGNIRFMGELFLRKIISITILKQISKALMGGAMSGTKHPSEHLTECFTELLTTIGYTMDQSLGGKEMLNDYMNILIKLKDANIYSVRINYRIQDLVELRDKNWQKKLFKEKATSVAQIHLEAQQEELRGGTIHVQQMGKYTTAGLQTSRHYSDYLVNQRKLAMAKIQNGVFLGTKDASGAPTNGNCASSASSAAAAQVVDDYTAADSTASMALVDVVDRLVTLALAIPPLHEFQDAWKRLKPNLSDAKEICRTLCHKATYAKTAAASSALAEIAAHCITKFTSGKDSKVLWEMVGQEFLVRLHDEILDNPRAVGIFATLCMTVFETMPASNFLLLERMQMPQERDTAKELCALVLKGIKNKGGQVQGPRRILQRCFAHSFSDAASVEKNTLV